MELFMTYAILGLLCLSFFLIGRMKGSELVENNIAYFKNHISVQEDYYRKCVADAKLENETAYDKLDQAQKELASTRQEMRTLLAELEAARSELAIADDEIVRLSRDKGNLQEVTSRQEAQIRSNGQMAAKLLTILNNEGGCQIDVGMPPVDITAAVRGRLLHLRSEVERLEKAANCHADSRKALSWRIEQAVLMLTGVHNGMVSKIGPETKPARDG